MTLLISICHSTVGGSSREKNLDVAGKIKYTDDYSSTCTLFRSFLYLPHWLLRVILRLRVSGLLVIHLLQRNWVYGVFLSTKSQHEYSVSFGRKSPRSCGDLWPIALFLHEASANREPISFPCLFSSFGHLQKILPPRGSNNPSILPRHIPGLDSDSVSGLAHTI